jgi:hypothetical protein
VPPSAIIKAIANAILSAKSAVEILRLIGPVPAGNSKWLTPSRESVDSRADGRPLGVDLVRYSRAIPVAGGIAGRNPCPSADGRAIKFASSCRLKPWSFPGSASRPLDARMETETGKTFVAPCPSPSRQAH